jgi:hypothetical protein
MGSGRAGSGEEAGSDLGEAPRACSGTIEEEAFVRGKLT